MTTRAASSVQRRRICTVSVVGRAVVLRLLGRFVEEVLIAPAEDHGVGSRRAESLGERSSDVGTPAEHDDALGLSEGVFHECRS